MEDKRLDQYCISHIHKLKRNCNKVLFPFFPIDLINNAYNIGHPSVVTSPKLEIDGKFSTVRSVVSCSKYRKNAKDLRKCFFKGYIHEKYRIV